MSSMVTFIAAYHYFRIFNSFESSYDFSYGNCVPIRTPTSTEAGFTKPHGG